VLQTIQEKIGRPKAPNSVLFSSTWNCWILGN